MLATVVEPRQFQTIGQQIVDRIKSPEDLTRELNILLESSEVMTRLLSPDTLRWRLSKWLAGGTFIMNGRYREITTPTLILVGVSDRLLPSGTEGKRLKAEMQSAMVDLKEYPDRGYVYCFI